MVGVDIVDNYELWRWFSLRRLVGFEEQKKYFAF